MNPAHIGGFGGTDREAGDLTFFLHGSVDPGQIGGFGGTSHETEGDNNNG
jgi:hypothetical protein